LLASIIIFVGLLLAFSRGAWGCFAVSTLLLTYILFVTQRDLGTRKRILFFLIGGSAFAVVIFVLLASIPAVNAMFLERGKVIQEYDVGGPGTRFMLQQISIEEILRHPFGMGPWVFMRAYGQATHNTFLGSMLNYGWVGGVAYLTLTALTLAVGMRALLLRTPWQTFLIAIYASFVAATLEAFVIDTDHWRHFFLLLGLIWGLSAATFRSQRGPQIPTPARAFGYVGLS
jgi:hypothetical protein